ncbi:radical SAM protein [Barnesiella sp. WM24]|uniref:radical SAM protein n=1 Tax=Barnesiella sp. WM24 TaxID=2558278 RepID=UPI0010729CF0|nr:radical SAM protein [Barnesiella sp. WM24]TFU93086.1 radical SAM protein [Barnesiella sp. WM24]
MVTILFHSTIFGPVHSRRLGTSLGVNLSPVDGKVCSFDCVYCEAGYNSQGTGKSGLPSREDVARQLESKLKEMSAAGEPLDVITFSGNGEPTMHPDFEGVIDDTLALRDRYYPGAKVSVLCNSTRLDREGVVNGLRKVDNCILKLDSALTPTMRLIDQPVSKTFTCEYVIPQLEAFGDKCIIQTMMLRGNHDGKHIDNTTPGEVDALIEAYKRIKPREVMLYSIDRATPESDLQKVEREELESIACRMRDAGITVQVS